MALGLELIACLAESRPRFAIKRKYHTIGPYSEKWNIPCCKGITEGGVIDENLSKNAASGRDEDSSCDGYRSTPHHRTKFYDRKSFKTGVGED
jgi:hypothetical protein